MSKKKDDLDNGLSVMLWNAGTSIVYKNDVYPTEQQLLEMTLGQEYSIWRTNEEPHSDTILRVPGGWIYKNILYSRNGSSVSTTFVPEPTGGK